MPGRISIATYLFRRLKQHGVEAIHGVPGDFTLRAIDQLKRAGIKWVGTCNELNAGYAADGYARIRGLGALLTTYGVGELSAINAVAGSFSEHVPVVHIVGVPNADATTSRGPIHHGLPYRPIDIFAKTHRPVCVAQCFVHRPYDACEQIDRTIQSALQYHQPVYLQLPSNAVDTMVSDSGLATRLSPFFTSRDIDERTETYAAEMVEKLQRAKFPLLLVDRGRDLDTARQELNDFVRHSGIPTITMPSGAGMIDHDIPNYLGVHSGPVGQIDTMPLIEQADLILAFGPMFSDTQTLGWKTVPSADKTIEIPNHSFLYRGNNLLFDRPVKPIITKSLLKLMTERLWPTSLRIHTNRPPLLKTIPDFRKLPAPEPSSSSDSSITQTSFYNRINPYLKPHDIILLGNATPILGGRDFILPSPTNRVICSGLSFSIGHMLPAALGAAIAQQHVHPEQSGSASSYAATHASSLGRVVLFDGDGSFQVSAQELSTIIRLRLNVTIFILNNAGYAYERLIHGMNEDYNDIPPWDYLSLPAAFGGREALQQAADDGEEYGISCACLRTWGDLDAFLADQRFDNGFEGTGRRGLKLIDVRVGRGDVPERFRTVFEAAGKSLSGKGSSADTTEAMTETKSEERANTNAPVLQVPVAKVDGRVRKSKSNIKESQRRQRRHEGELGSGGGEEGQGTEEKKAVIELPPQRDGLSFARRKPRSSVPSGDI